MSALPGTFSLWSVLALKQRCGHCGAMPLDWCLTYRGTTTSTLHRKRFAAAGWEPGATPPSTLTPATTSTAHALDDARAYGRLDT